MLPPISALILPAAPFAWWCMLLPLILAVGVALWTPRSLEIRFAISLLAVVLIVDAVILGSFLPYLGVTRPMGHPIRQPPGGVQLVTNVLLLLGATIWATYGAIREAKRPSTQPNEAGR